MNVDIRREDVLPWSGRSASTNAIERGQRRLSAEDLIDIGKALAIAPERLLKHILI